MEEPKQNEFEYPEVDQTDNNMDGFKDMTPKLTYPKRGKKKFE